MPSAHAFGWVDALDFFVPISSIQNMVEQINLIGTENFDAVLLVISAIDILTTFAPPLKAVSKPLAKFAANPVLRKFMKIMGPILGNAAGKAIKTRSLEPIEKLLPLLLVVGEILADEEARLLLGTIADSVSSSDDMQHWFDYFSLPVGGYDGEEPPVASFTTPSKYTFPSLINNAYAAGPGKKRINGLDFAKPVVKKATKYGLIGKVSAAKALLKTIKGIIRSVKDNTELRALIFKPEILVAASLIALNDGSLDDVLGILQAGKNKVKGKNKIYRIPLLANVGSILYLESRMNGFCEDCAPIVEDKLKEKIRKQYLTAFSGIDKYGSTNSAVGAQYQLAVIMAKQALHEIAPTQNGKVLDIERSENIDIWFQRKGSQDLDKYFTYGRRVDIVVENPDDLEHPVWVEVKSLAGKNSKKSQAKVNSTLNGHFAVWKFRKRGAKAKGTSAYREYYLDKVASINNQLLKPKIRKTSWKASKVEWLLHDFKIKTVKGLSATQLSNVQNLLSKKPNVGQKNAHTRSLGITTYNQSIEKIRAKREVKLYGTFHFLAEGVLDKMMEEFSDDLKENLKQQILQAQ